MINDRKMTLLELCEPLFQYVCMLNRIARNPTGEDVQYAGLRQQIDSLFASMKERAETDARLSSQYKKVEPALVFFVDSMIAESKLKVAPEWHRKRIAYEQNELAGDEKFFDLLDETLAEQGADANERLAVFYVCLGLGFMGWYAGQPEYLRKKTLSIAQRIGDVIDVQQTVRLTPEAYDYTDTRNLVEPPGVKLATMAILFIGCLLIVLVVNFYLFHTASSTLAESLKEILPHDLMTAGK